MVHIQYIVLFDDCFFYIHVKQLQLHRTRIHIKNINFPGVHQDRLQQMDLNCCLVTHAEY